MRLAVVLVAACGVRAPAAVDVGALLAQRGPVEARRDLEIRILADAQDLQTRLALAALDERIGRPSEAIEQLEFVEKVGGPIGTRWHDEDRARLARLLQQRGKVRVQHEAGSALRDFEHARELGASIGEDEITSAKLVVAKARLRHVDPEVRASGRKLIAEITKSGPNPGGDGAFAWKIGAKREAYEQLTVWHRTAKEPRDGGIEEAYLRALAWWSPPEAPIPDEATGPARCYFVGAGCAPPPEPAATATGPSASDPPTTTPPSATDPPATAAARYALVRSGVTARPRDLDKIALARDPAVAERYGRDYVAMSVDAASAHAAVGAMFDALGDPARARANWQAAADASPEPLYFWGLAEACARTGDGPAALVHATTAAAAWGDPAVVWVGVARALEERGNHVDALTAAGSAIDLGDIETLPPALDIAIAASRALGRDAQVKDLEQRRARLPHDAEREEALAAVRALPNAVTVARAWVISRAHPRDAELRATMLAGMTADDPRRSTLIDELVTLAGDSEPAIALTAARVLR